MVARWFTTLDVRLTRWLARHGVALLRISLGIVFLWFGVLKFFPGASPAQDLAVRTMDTLSFGLLPARLAMPVLASWECLLGVGLILGVLLRAVLLLLVIQMAGTLAPLLLFPDEVFERFPWVPTLEGQYIIKNLVLVSAALVIGATVRGGKLVADPGAASRAAPPRDKGRR